MSIRWKAENLSVANREYKGLCLKRKKDGKYAASRDISSRNIRPFKVGGGNEVWGSVMIGGKKADLRRHFDGAWGWEDCDREQQYLRHVGKEVSRAH